MGYLELEGFSVDFTVSVFLYCLAVLLCAVSLVLSEIIYRILVMVSVHHTVSRYLCDNRGRCHGDRKGITPDDCSLGNRNVDGVDTVDKDEIRGIAEIGDRLFHRPQCRPQDIDAINERGSDYTEADGKGIFFYDVEDRLSLSG